MEVRYLHTLNQKPAYFDGKEVHFLWQQGKTPQKAVACKTLKQIRSEQKASAEYRAKRGWKDPWPYGWVKFYVGVDKD